MKKKTKGLRGNYNCVIGTEQATASDYARIMLLLVNEKGVDCNSGNHSDPSSGKLLGGGGYHNSKATVFRTSKCAKVGAV